MNKKIKQLFKEIPTAEPSNKLYGKILFAIEKDKQIKRKIGFWFFAFTTILAFLSLIPAILYLLANLSSSGFYRYISLIFSDTEILLSNWKDYSMTLIESVPFAQITICFSIIFLILCLLKMLANSLPKKLLN